jgi:hypothetical protein
MIRGRTDSDDDVPSTIIIVSRTAARKYTNNRSCSCRNLSQPSRSLLCPARLGSTRSRHPNVSQRSSASRTTTSVPVPRVPVTRPSYNPTTRMPFEQGRGPARSRAACRSLHPDARHVMNLVPRPVILLLHCSGGCATMACGSSASRASRSRSSERDASLLTDLCNRCRGTRMG